MQTGIPCPECNRPDGRPAEFVNHYAHVIYFRCAECGHVWHIPKPGTPGVVTDVTPPRKQV